jgi:hypothetical protein
MIRMMHADTRIPAETKDFGSVGCSMETWEKNPITKEALGKPVHSTTCILVRGGFLTLGMASDDQAKVSFDVVRRFLEAAAAKR